MNRYARMATLLDAMAVAGHLEVADLAKQLGVSATTIRRDLKLLHERQLLTRTRGGAVAATLNYDLPNRYLDTTRSDEKTRIGQAAAALVSQGDIVGINGGTTAAEVVRAIAQIWPAMGGVSRPVTVVTNAINIVNEPTVRRHVRLVMTGGESRLRSCELIGPFAADVLARISLDYAIIGVDAFDPETGAMADDAEEAKISLLMVRQARTTVVVADGSKLTARSFACACPLEDTDLLITDKAAPANLVAIVRGRGIKVVAV